jgi:F-type H+-transporting ATPase subunit alpha
MADKTTLARPYARAVFDIAHAAGELAAWDDFLRIAAAAVSEPRLRDLLDDPARTPEGQAVLLTGVFPDGLSGEQRNLLKLLAHNERLGVKGFAMSLKASEISELIKERIKNFDAASEARNVGTITLLADGIVRIHGLADVQYGEMLEFPGDTFGLALNLEQDSVGAVVLGDYKHLSEGDEVKTTGRILEVPVGRGLLGRVVDALGRPIDGKGEITPDGYSPIEKVAPGVIARQSVDQPVQTGLKAIDAMVPVGRGQRELIIGDRQTGKTAVAVDAIINQKGKGILCIYVAVGQKNSSVAGVVRKLEEHGAMDHTIVVSASASESAAMQYIAPYAGCAMGEYFRDRGEDALIVYDDLSKQACRLPPGLAAAASPAGPRSLPG